ncbi:MAG: serpin family protein [Bacteroidales bacterium]|nr:serpin family protein [Bacteroidales bacterium]
MKKVFLLALSFVVLGLLTGCYPTAPEEDEDNTYKRISLTTKQREYINAGNAFSYRFIAKIDENELKTEKKDWFVSPLSLQFALGMLLNAAKGQTADEICQTLGYGAGETAEINDLCKMLLIRLPDIDKQTDLSIADAIFVKKDVTLKEPYVNVVENYYDASIESLDFSLTDKAAKHINDWCSKQTKGMIPKVIDQVNPDNLAYLINALYFKSQWQEKFPKGNTASETFTDENGTTGKVKMMKLDGKQFNYGETDAYQFVRLPYGNGAFEMTVLLPKKGYTVHDLTILLDNENPAFWESRSTKVDLWLPKFETKYHILLNDILAAMGMPGSFISGADFTAMSDRADHVDFVTQDAAIKVDEEGTEAAAVTVIGMKEAAALPPGSAVFHADHPFLYLITEFSTGAVLFAGKYSGK